MVVRARFSICHWIVSIGLAVFLSRSLMLIARTKAILQAKWEKIQIWGDSSVITATFTGPRQTSLFPKAARPAAPCATYCYHAVAACCRIGLSLQPRSCQSAPQRRHCRESRVASGVSQVDLWSSASRNHASSTQHQQNCRRRLRNTYHCKRSC